jgi:hypothetical protein
MVVVVVVVQQRRVERCSLLLRIRWPAAVEWPAPLLLGRKLLLLRLPVLWLPLLLELEFQLPAHRQLLLWHLAQLQKLLL